MAATSSSRSDPSGAMRERNNCVLFGGGGMEAWVGAHCGCGWG